MLTGSLAIAELGSVEASYGFESARIQFSDRLERPLVIESEGVKACIGVRSWNRVWLAMVHKDSAGCWCYKVIACDWQHDGSVAFSIIVAKSRQTSL